MNRCAWLGRAAVLILPASPLGNEAVENSVVIPLGARGFHGFLSDGFSIDSTPPNFGSSIFQELALIFFLKPRW